MFYLRKQNQDCNNCDEFGWWLFGSKPEAENPSTSDSVSGNGSIPSTTSCDDGNSSFVFVQESGADDPEDGNDLGDRFPRKIEDTDPGEICFAEEPTCEASSLSYTPERIIRTQDYRIITPSPTFSSPTPRTESSTPIGTPSNRYSNRRHRRLSHLIDRRLVGASQLEAVLDPEALDIKLPVAMTRRKIFQNRLLPKESKCSGDLLAIANSDSPGRLSTPDLMSSGSSCEHLNPEWDHYEGTTVAENDSLRIKKLPELRKVFESGSDSTEVLLGDEISRENLWRRALVPEVLVDPEIAVEQLSGRIDHIKDINKDIFEDLSLLRKNFQLTERKAGNLTTETSSLRKEIRDLRYLDDLVNLLRGELERISQRNWPFNLGHTDRHTEEVNLVI